MCVDCGMSVSAHTRPLWHVCRFWHVYWFRYASLMRMLVLASVNSDTHVETDVCWFWHYSEVCVHSDTCRFWRKCWFWRVDPANALTSACIYSDTWSFNTCWLWHTCWLCRVWALARMSTVRCMSMWQCSVASRWPWCLSCSCSQKLAVSQSLTSHGWLLGTESRVPVTSALGRYTVTTSSVLSIEKIVSLVIKDQGQVIQVPEILKASRPVILNQGQFCPRGWVLDFK